MGHQEFLSAAGLRVDGRRPQEFRKLEGKLSVIPQVDGSAFLQQGNTQVLVNISGPREGIISREDTGQAALHIEWNHSSQQAGRPITLQSTSTSSSSNFEMRRIQDWLISIEKVFEQVILLQTIPNSDIFIHVTIFQSEGGLFACVVNAITLALIDAGIPMTDYVTACSIGLVSEGSLQTSWILDTNILEEQNSHQVPTMTTVFAPRNRQLLCMQMEPPSKISLDNLHGWMNAAKQATEIIYSKLNDIVKNAAK